MATIAIDADNFREHVSRPGLTLIEFWAEWCGPCRYFGPLFERVSERHPDVVCGKVNTEVQTELAGALRIRSIPTLMAFRDGVLLFNEPGALPEAVLDALLAQIRALDMDDIRASLKNRPAP